jgi:hypothetical protein
VGWSVCTAVQKRVCAKAASYSTGILSPGWRFAHLPPVKNQNIKSFTTDQKIPALHRSRPTPTQYCICDHPVDSIVSSRTVLPVYGEGDPYPQCPKQQYVEIDIHPAHSSIDPLLEGVCVIVGYSVGYSPPVFLIILSASFMRISHWAQLPCTFSAMARVFMALLSAYSGASDRLPLTVMFW